MTSDILTFEREFTLVWSTKWNLTKVLFFLTRYLAFVDLATVIYRKGFYLLFAGHS